MNGALTSPLLALFFDGSLMLGSSVAEQVTVNHLVVGSTPTRAATLVRAVSSWDTAFYVINARKVPCAIPRISSGYLSQFLPWRGQIAPTALIESAEGDESLDIRSRGNLTRREFARVNITGAVPI
jgi:hypothetical protein